MVDFDITLDNAHYYNNGYDNVVNNEIGLRIGNGQINFYKGQPEGNDFFHSTSGKLNGIDWHAGSAVMHFKGSYPPSTDFCTATSKTKTEICTDDIRSLHYKFK